MRVGQDTDHTRDETGYDRNTAYRRFGMKQSAGDAGWRLFYN